jgi:hypothetical protein
MNLETIYASRRGIQFSHKDQRSQSSVTATNLPTKRTERPGHNQIELELVVELELDFSSIRKSLNPLIPDTFK